MKFEKLCKRCQNVMIFKEKDFRIFKDPNNNYKEILIECKICGETNTLHRIHY